MPKVEEEEEPPRKKAKKALPFKTTGDYYGLFLEALEICRQHRLHKDLDLVDVMHLRLSSKGCGKVAAKMALDRLRNVTLKCRVIDRVHHKMYDLPLAGVTCTELTRTHEHPYTTNLIAGSVTTGSCIRYTITDPKTYQEDWKTPTQEEKERKRNARENYLNICVHDVEVLLQLPGEEDSEDGRMMGCFSDTAKLTFKLDHLSQKETGQTFHKKGWPGGSLEYEIIQAQQTAIEGDDDAPSPEIHRIHHKVSFRIKSISIDFKVLLGFILYKKELELYNHEEAIGRPLNDDEQKVRDAIRSADRIFGEDPVFSEVYDHPGQTYYR